jgi:glucuronate isomerase
MDAQKGWVQQLHLGALRNNNTRMYESLGADTGFDAIGDWQQARTLAAFLDRLDRHDALPKTVLYTLNPSVNEVLGTLMGCFQGGGIPGKIQFGSAWWFNDHRSGIERHIAALSNLGMLSTFIGMLTDSRSFLSYPRHDFFRRVLCNVLGEDIEKGYVPNDYELVGSMVRDICFTNAKRYFGYTFQVNSKRY